jgi:hypothetical protein
MVGYAVKVQAVTASDPEVLDLVTKNFGEFLPAKQILKKQKKKLL